MPGAPATLRFLELVANLRRTFHIDPSGRLLVAAHIMGLPVREDGGTRFVPACLSLFRIATSGRLEFVRKYDVDVGDRTMWWMGMVTL